MAIFFLQPITFGGWLPRIPDVQQALGLGPAALALALIGLPCGTLLTLPFSGPLVGRIGPWRAMLAGFPLHLLAVCLPTLAPSQLTLFIALMLTGASLSFLELGLNVEAAETEKSTGELIMSKSHGFWSFGIMAGSLIGSGLAALGLPPHFSVPIAAIVCLPIALILLSLLPRDHGVAAPTQHESHRLTLPSWPLLLICLFVVGISITEGAMADWSAVYLRTVFSADAGAAGLGYSAFALVVALGRLAGDMLRERWGAVMLARVCGVLAVVGVALLALAPNSIAAYLGFGVIGLGVSVGFPLAVSAAAALPGTSSQNVAVLTFVALAGFLVGPPVIGFVSEHIEMRVGLAALIPVLVLSLAFAGRLRPASKPN